MLIKINHMVKLCPRSLYCRQLGTNSFLPAMQWNWRPFADSSALKWHGQKLPELYIQRLCSAQKDNKQLPSSFTSSNSLAFTSGMPRSPAKSNFAHRCSTESACCWDMTSLELHSPHATGGCVRFLHFRCRHCHSSLTVLILSDGAWNLCRMHV